MKRLFDLFFGVALFILLVTPMLLIIVVVRLTSKGSSFYWSDRVGQNNAIFKMPKFRSMLINTQLFSVLKGDMSFVGPRPALFNQVDLIALRKEKGVDKLLPGITGWAQINGRDTLSIVDKVSLDVEYMQRQSFWFDMKILWMTFLRIVKRDGVSH